MYAGSAYGFNSGGSSRQEAYNYNPVTEQLARNQQMQAYQQSPDYQREMYERGLQQQEQQRRMYDSQTARQSQERKYGVLDGLMKKIGQGDGAGMQSWGFSVGTGGTTRY
jgi:hypothetical protein